MKNDIVRAKCIDMSIDGQGIVKSNGLVIFVKGLILDEVADIKIIAEKKNMAFGIIDKLIEASPHRVESSCPIAYKCGGCDYRHIDYDYQLYLKKRSLINTFKNMNLDVNVLDVIKADNPDYYRNKVQVPIKNHEFGFYRKFSNDIVEFEDCKIQSSLSNEIFLFVKKELLELKIDKYFRHILIKHGFGSGEVMLGLIVYTRDIPKLDILIEDLINTYACIKSIILNINDQETNVILGKEEILLFGRDYIIDEFSGVKVKIALKSFYQTNHSQMIKLYSLVKELTNVDSNSEVLDLYSGIGSISLFLAKYVKHITGVEIVKEAVDNAIENVKLNNYSNVDYYLDDASKRFDKYLENKDIVIVDPPRKGLSKELIEKLIEKDISKIVYVSCNPATLARDLTIFKNYYKISDIYPVDMFPHTLHVECVVGMQRKDNK